VYPEEGKKRDNLSVRPRKRGEESSGNPFPEVKEKKVPEGKGRQGAAATSLDVREEGKGKKKSSS